MLLLLSLACATATPQMDTTPAPLPAPATGQEVAVFAGGCFWCMESDFDHLEGVVSTTSGYMGGHLDHPTYEMVNTETTGHAESVRVVFDTRRLSYTDVLAWFWTHVDPTDAGGQFCDRGDSYRTEIFAMSEAQHRAATDMKAKIDAAKVLPGPIVTEIRRAYGPDAQTVEGTFFPAESYHQDFHHTNPGRYQPYRKGCGRDARVAEVWRLAPKSLLTLP